MRERFHVVKEFLAGYFSSDQAARTATAVQHPVATATTTRFFMNTALNTGLPMLLMDFLIKEYPDTAKDMQLYLKDIQVYMAVINILGVSTLFTALEYAGRKYTGNLLTPPNFRTDALYGAMVALVMQTFASTEYGKANGVGKFWNHLAAVNPFLLMIYTFFLIPGLLKGSISLSKQVLKDVKGLAGRVCVADENTDVPVIGDGNNTESMSVHSERTAASTEQPLLSSDQGVAEETRGVAPVLNRHHLLVAPSSTSSLSGSNVVVRGSNSPIPR